MARCWWSRRARTAWAATVRGRRGSRAGRRRTATAPDPSWAPLLPTPAFQEYPAGHPGVSAAAATVLAAACGDQTPSTVIAAGAPAWSGTSIASPSPSSGSRTLACLAASTSASQPSPAPAWEPRSLVTPPSGRTPRRSSPGSPHLASAARFPPVMWDPRARHPRVSIDRPSPARRCSSGSGENERRARSRPPH